jgi:MoxR-like ATPase
MEDIIRVHFPDIKNSLLEDAMESFYSLRKIDDLRKKPSTSELIDWIQALMASGLDGKIKDGEIPFLGTLIKKETDINYYVSHHIRRKPGSRDYNVYGN